MGQRRSCSPPRGAGQSPFTRHPLKPISLSFVLEDCGVLKIYSSATGFSLVCPSFIKLIGHNLRGDSVRSGRTQRPLGTPKKPAENGDFLWNHMNKNLLPWSSDPFKQLSLKPLVWCRLSNHLAPAHPWKMLRPKLETSDVLLSKNRPTWKWDSWHELCWLKWVMLYIYIHAYKNIFIYIRIHTHIFPTVWLVIDPVSQPVNSCGFFVSKHHPPSLSEKENQATTSCPGLTPELEAPHGTTFQVLEGSTNWMLPTMSLWYHRARLRKDTSFQKIHTESFWNCYPPQRAS